MRPSKYALFLLLSALPSLPAAGGANQRPAQGGAALKQMLERLRVTGSVLMIAAHPDDENTAVLAWCAQGRKLRTAYLSLTRGEGGQNLIGSEQGDLLGLIRTQELLAARRIDGAEQYFTRAIDFGFSKSAEETIAKWGRREVLADIVWVIRKFRPDVIINRFSGTGRDGHGHHQASAILSREAFDLAGDPAAFPEQLKDVQPWRPKRLLWNGFSFNRQQEQELDKLANRLVVDTGEYDPVLGSSYGELAGVSRSQHKSQGMGAQERRGSVPNYLMHIAGEPASRDFLDGVDTTWNRLPGGAAIDRLLQQAIEAWRIDRPEGAIGPLCKARPVIAAMDDPIARRKLADLDEAIALAAGLWLDVSVAPGVATPGTAVEFTLTAVNRSRATAALERVQLIAHGSPPAFETAVPLEFNKPLMQRAKWTIPADTPLVQPYWLASASNGLLYRVEDLNLLGLAEAPAPLRARFYVRVDGQTIAIERPVERRFVDRVKGEITEPFSLLPPVSLKLPAASMIFPDATPRTVIVEVRANQPKAEGTVSLQLPAAWRPEPAEAPFSIAAAGQTSQVRFRVTPGPASGELAAAATIGGRRVVNGLVRIDYDHIPPQTVQPPVKMRVTREDVKILSRRIGYVMGAGDMVPASLEQLGCEVTMLSRDDLAQGDLSRFDAIVTGVRAWNVRMDLRMNAHRLHAYVERGGTLLVQFNTTEGNPFSGEPSPISGIGPFPMRLSRDRVSVEEVPVKLLKPGHPLLESPNVIRPDDFSGWVQERGLYFPTDLDQRYECLLEMSDPGEKPLQSGIVFARVGRGAYIYTPLAWFRQLPAGVPGAFKIFANLLSAGGAAPRQ
jgi:LmbE family N-acetylglucosaminyl deacetylase